MSAFKINQSNDTNLETASNSKATIAQSSSFNAQKKRLNSSKSRDVNTDSSSNFEFDPKKSLPPNYCVNVNIEGSRTMDRVSHLSPTQMDTNCLANRLRPISGIRNHIKRNLTMNQTDFDIIRDTDLVQKIGSFKALKRLDLSNNLLKTYPRQLCDLNLLESLNLTGNNLEETDFPLEAEKYQNLIELVLDSNKFKRLPKCVSKLKKLSRLSMRNNFVVDLKLIENLKKLRFLILDNNLITCLEDNIKMLEKLEILHLSNNSMTILDGSILKNSLNCLKQLDLSSNKLVSLTTEIFMLPHLEMLNLSNNKLTRLPLLPSSYFRTIPIFFLDLSLNQLIRFYDYLLTLAKNIDLTSNKIKTIPSKVIENLTPAQLNSKTLKLEENPLIDPPIEICLNGLKLMKNYFDEESRKIQLNRGFKIMLLGDNQSGKTTLSYALEDFNSQSNLIEQFSSNSSNSANVVESKFIEIHDLFFKFDEMIEEKPEDNPPNGEIITDSKFYEALLKKRKIKKSDSFHSTSSFDSLKKSKSKNDQINVPSPLPNSSAKRRSSRATPVSFNNLTNPSLKNVVLKKTRMPVTIYDFNGSIKQFAHLMDNFIDKTSLVVICIDALNFIEIDGKKSSDEVKCEKYLKSLLDLIILKMNKITSFYLLPILTKCDKILSKQTDRVSLNPPILKNFTAKVDNIIKTYIDEKLGDIKTELKKIELLSNITASQSDRLKQLVQTQANLNPEIHKPCQTVSSIRMDGVETLTNTIKDIVCNNKKYFAEVNKKVPSFFIEAENYACNHLSEIPLTKYVDDHLKIINSSNQPNMSILCVEYEFYKGKIIDKYGLGHLVDTITKYMSTSGRVVWFYETEKLRSKVFLRPTVLFDLLFVLYRTNFSENFLDTHTQALRNKLAKNTVNMNEDNIKKLQNDFLTKGHLNIDLLKLLWYPILITDSVELVQDAFLLFATYFNIGYPDVSKEKLKLLFNTDPNIRDQMNKFNELNKINPSRFNNIIIPFYLPKLDDESKLNKIRSGLKAECASAAAQLLSLKLKNETSKHLAKLSQKYTFPWGLLPGLFDKFTTNCILNSDLYYKIHLKNFIHAYNEENSIGILIYMNTINQTKPKVDEVVFEFYLTSYATVLERLETNKAKDENFEQNFLMDMDMLWIVALKILQLFEDTIISSYPSLRFDRFSQCPECEEFGLLGEWFTPKELQKCKFKNCQKCEKLIDYFFLVKPTTGQNLTLDIKKLQQRLENLSKDIKPNTQNTSQQAAKSKTAESKSNSLNESKPKTKI